MSSVDQDGEGSAKTVQGVTQLLSQGVIPNGNEQDSTKSSVTNFDKLVFGQDLAEVTLLLDFISGRRDIKLAELDGRFYNDANPKVALTTAEVIRKVSELKYPPQKPPREKSEDAAFLLLLKDALNSIAYPARGLTIAYTTMFMEEGKYAAEKDGQSATGRLEAARTAYPDLRMNATKFRNAKRWLTRFTVLITLLASIFLWQVSYGAQLAARFDEAKKNDSLTSQRVFEEINRFKVNASSSSTGDDNLTSYDLSSICELTVSDAMKQTGRQNPLIQQSCNEYAYRHAQLCVAIADVGEYGQSWFFRLFELILPMHPLRAAVDCEGSKSVGISTSKIGENTGPSENYGPNGNTYGRIGENKTVATQMGRQEDAKSIAGVLSILSNYFLPGLFGLVGTLAALVRGLQDKITESMLSPRDRSLVWIRLPLGLVAGVSVGLFFNTDNIISKGVGATEGFAISASGIAFLAGYGAEAFFRLLDNLMNRIFSLDGSANRASAPL
ncbi:hypothetical protein [Methylobacterium sp. Leaf113]|uniref:hypothetical protein n=1 Tax=Methylobacterium sp. Leaf113 TaxID=1736259 RepID=UPI000B0EC772|nr:hypothetical protein [Methylobacterium sp. Leaf113]